MKHVTMWVGAVVAVVMMASTASAASGIAIGKVKSVDAEKQQFVLTDGNEKDWTIKIGAQVVINRNGKESNSDLKVGDPVSVCYDRGLITWTANYILIKEGAAKGSTLSHGTFKSFNADKKEFTVTDTDGKDWRASSVEATIRLNMEPSSIEAMRVGDSILMVLTQTGDKSTVTHVMAGRDK